MEVKNFSLIVLIIIAAFVVRSLPTDFPQFTQEEARIASRGYALSTTGKDELGRSYPILFNSLEDYRLPLVSYITTVGIALFGKSDFGVRFPFILMGTITVYLVYRVSRFFSQSRQLWLTSGFIAALSPALIFLSRVPNEAVTLTFFLTLLFYLLINKKNLILTVTVMLLAVFTSKLSWFILIPFVSFTLYFFQKKLDIKRNLILFCITCCIVTASFILFLFVPQATRSLLENNFAIFSDVTIKNGIDQLRGQGLQSNWPPYLEKILFNKTHFLTVGCLNWLSHLAPSVLFGQFDQQHVNGFNNLGALQKILVIPFVVGLFYIIQKSDRRQISLLIFPFILTLPTLFSSTRNATLILATLPFISLIIALGFIKVNRVMRTVIVCFMVFEIGVNFFSLDAETKSAVDARPGWVGKLISDGLSISANQKLAFSDNLTQDLAPYIQWYMKGQGYENYKDITFPYRFRQSKIANIKIIGSDDTFYKCGQDTPTYIIASKRDLEEIGRWLNIKTDEAIKKVYIDDLGHEVAFMLEPTICVH